jgi:hypothetical protein
MQVSTDDHIERGTVEVLYKESCYKLSIKDYANKKSKEGKVDNL